MSSKTSGPKGPKKGAKASKHPRPTAGRYSGPSLEATAPSAVTSISRKDRSKPVRVVQTEEVSDVVCQAGFENSSLVINPGNEDLFPWGSSIAQHFTSFEWKKLVFRYVASTDTATSGTVAMAVNADPDKPAFATEKQLLNHEGSATAAPWKSFAVDALSTSTKTLGDGSKFVEDVTGAGVTGFFDSLQTIATGALNIATLGLAIAGSSADLKTDPIPKTTGKLFADYDVILWDPADPSLVADDGISAFKLGGVNNQFIEPVAFAGEVLVNPLRVTAVPVGTGITSWYVTEPGRYEIGCYFYYSSPKTLANMTGTLLDISGSSATTVFWNGVPCLSGDGYNAIASTIVDIPDVIGDHVILQVGAPMLANLDNTNSLVLFSRVSGGVDFATAHAFLPPGKRGCLPDCKASAVVSYLKDQHHLQKARCVASETRRLTTGLVKVSQSLPARTPTCPDEKTSSEDSKQDLSASTASFADKLLPLCPPTLPFVEKVALGLRPPTLTKSGAIAAATTLSAAAGVGTPSVSGKVRPGWFAASS